MDQELKKLLLDNARAFEAYANGEDVEYEYHVGSDGWVTTDSVVAVVGNTGIPYGIWLRIKPVPKHEETIEEWKDN